MARVTIFYMKSNKTSWSQVASWYDTMIEEGDGTFQKDVILPNIIRLMSIRPGTRVVDMACGQGFFAREFAHAGAYVSAADISPELIVAAENHLKKETRLRTRPQFFVAPAHRMTAVATGSADIVTIILALQNIKELPETLSEVSRMLKPGGRLLVVLNHPAFRIPKSSSWAYDDNAKVQYRRIDSYLSERTIPIDMHPGGAKRTYTVSFHRPLQVYAKHLGKAGLYISNMEEWISNRRGPKGKTYVALEHARKEIPLFLFIEARKIA